ncbi:Peptidase family M50 [Fragilaria crotonensis]|nr:Peptidase family M50 [Fragilaria crotonensis]
MMRVVHGGLVLLTLGSSLGVLNAFQHPLPSAQANGRHGRFTSSDFYYHNSLSRNARKITTSSSTQHNAVMNPLLSSIASPIGAIVVLASVILVHESGHYLAARALGIKVEEFSIGVGPKLLGKKAFGNDFSLRALPLGGYVRFPEHYNTTQAQQAEMAKMLQGSVTETPFQRTLNDILSFGTYQDMLRQEEERVQKELKARPWWKKFGPKREAASQTKTEIEYYDDPDLLQNRPWPERAVVIAGGVIFNLILAFCIYFGQITVGSGLPKPFLEPGARVSVTPTGDAAAVGLLQKGDVILKVNGTPLTATSKPLTVQMSQKAINDFIAKIQATPEGDALKLQVLKAGSETTSTSPIIDLAIRPKSNGQVQAIGVLLGPNVRRIDRIRSDSVGEATKIAGSAVTELTQETASGLSQLVSAMVPGKGGGSGGKLSGPIGLIQTGSEVVSTSDAAAVLMFAAAISVNLAVVNALPLPALDGGQMVFILVEALSRRKVDQRLQENITSAAVLLLLLLSLSTTVGDVEGLFAK